MSREKQIEEMRSFMLEKSNSANVEPVFTTSKGKEIVLGEDLTKLLNDVLEQAFIPFLAEALYNAGYRKQSVGEWLVDAWDNQKEEWVTIPYNKHLHADAYCSLCKKPALLNGAGYGAASNYCPDCGAKMKGGVK